MAYLHLFFFGFRTCRNLEVSLPAQHVDNQRGNKVDVLLLLLACLTLRYCPGMSAGWRTMGIWPLSTARLPTGSYKQLEEHMVHTMSMLDMDDGDMLDYVMELQKRLIAHQLTWSWHRKPVREVHPANDRGWPISRDNCVCAG